MNERIHLNGLNLYFLTFIKKKNEKENVKHINKYQTCKTDNNQTCIYNTVFGKAVERSTKKK